jgi:hypothetical protein
MYENEINKLLDTMEYLSGTLSPKLSLEQLIAFLIVCQREEIPLVDLADKMDWSLLKTSRTVSTLADRRYGNGRYSDGYEILYTAEDKDNRIFKNAFLTHKGKEIKGRLVKMLKSLSAAKS